MPEAPPAIVRRAREHGTSGAKKLGDAQQAQFVEDVEAGEGGELPAPSVPIGTRRIRAFQLSSVRPEIRMAPGERPDESVITISRGINLIVDGLPALPGQMLPEAIDLAADRVVIWTVSMDSLDLAGEQLQAHEAPLEIYMEGNIVFRQGERVVYADRMYYDVRQRVGTIVNTEILTPAPGYQGLVRLKADLVQQTSRDTYYARDAFLTSSRFGVPRYRMAASDVFFEDSQRPASRSSIQRPASWRPSTCSGFRVTTIGCTSARPPFFTGRFSPAGWRTLGCSSNGRRCATTAFSGRRRWSTWTHFSYWGRGTVRRACNGTSARTT
jgi:hypothetical protein